jgi:membrane fusion protein, multidrug efflux system
LSARRVERRLAAIFASDDATGNFTKIVQRVPVRIVLEDDDAELGTLRPGLSVVARVDERGHGDIREAHR